MKKLISILLGLSFISAAYSQDPESQIQKLKALESRDSTLSLQKTDTLKERPLLKVKADSAKFRIGRSTITIFDDGNNTTLKIPNNRKFCDDWDTEYHHKSGFQGHWSGFEFGVNGLMDKNRSLNLKGDLAALDLKQARSWNINLNFMQYSIGFGTDKIGLITGMGLEFNNYHFSNPISLKMENGITIVDSSYIKGNFDVQKSKLSTTHLTIPLLLEIQIPTGERGHRIYISGGVIGGLRIGAHTKVIYENGGRKKDKNHDDFNLSTFRYGFTARIGYRGLKLFANYYPVALFEKDKGPEVYPFSVGLVLFNFND
ncbi:MAG: outer membrane beta-barrel protein [Bacteroidales bacterium]|nr:outer membrane beta-barrel protein [Bacteroidales bacterium]